MSPSYRIVFYVSGHGFGHTARSIEVIHALLRQRPGARVVVKTSAPRHLYERTLRGLVEVVDLQCDIGMIQIDSLNVDTGASVRQARDFQARLPQLAAEETAYLRAEGADVVVGDIPPLAFVSAAAAGVPSVAIGNFTWDWIYEGYADADASARELASEIRDAYRQVTRVLRLPMTGGFAGLDSIATDIPFIARRSHRQPDEVREALGVPAGPPLVLLSFGGYGVAGLDTGAFAALTHDYTIATTDLAASEHTIAPASGLLTISERDLYGRGLRYEDLVRAADVVVTKPGYGIISEAIANDTALLYTSRGHFVEYDVLVREMPKYLRTEFIDQRDLLAGNWAAALKRVLDKPKPTGRPALNGAEVAAEVILEEARKAENGKRK